MSLGKQVAKKTINTLMTHILCGRTEQARELFADDVEPSNLPAAGRSESLVFSILDAEKEGDTVVVSVELEDQSEDSPSKEVIPFVCVETDDGPKVDMGATLSKIMGGSPDELLDAMKEGLSGLAEDMEDAMETVFESEEELSPELYSPDNVSDEFRQGVVEIGEEIDGEMESIADRLENEDLVWQIAWGTMCDDEYCPRRLLTSVISPLRSALAMLEDHESQDPDAKEGASIRKIRENIKTIRIMNMSDWRLCECTLQDGRLTLMPCLRPTMDSETVATQGFTSDEIGWAIRDALDLDVSGAIKRTEAALADFVADCTERVGFTPQVTVDWDSFRSIGNGQDTLDALKRFRDDLLSSVHYALFHLKKNVPLAECLESLCFRHVQDVEERTITVDGATITFCVPLVERSTCYSTEKIQELLEDLAKQLPIPAQEEEPQDQAVCEEAEEDEAEREIDLGPSELQEAAPAEQPPAASGFQQMVDSMESDMMGPMRDQMSQMFGKEFRMDVDWDSMDEDEDHFTLVVSGAMGAVMGALMVMAYDPARKGPVVAAVDGMALRYDPAVRGVALSLDNGILAVACGGPASEFVPDPNAMGEAITALLS